MDTGMAKKLIELQEARKSLEADVAKLRAEEAMISAELVDQFIDDGVKSINMDGKTLYLHEQLWASAGGNVNAVKQLEAAGLEDCVAVGTMRLSSVVREMGEEEFFQTYPDLKNSIKTETRTQVRVRKA